MIYPQIQPLWKRGDKGVLLENDYSLPEFEMLKDMTWYCTEKIDGTNIRVCFEINPDTLEIDTLQFKGRTDNAEIPIPLLKYLGKTFTKDKLLSAFEYKGKYPTTVVIYGEGYGPKIQSGGKYRKDVSFIGFDIVIDFMWTDPDVMIDILDKLDVDYVPELGELTQKQIITKCNDGFKSNIPSSDLLAEGIVARTNPLLLRRNGDPLKFKLKLRDYRKLNGK